MDSAIINFDIDIDVADRTKLLNTIKHVPAAIDHNVKHNSGIYLQKIPINPNTGLSTILYKDAPASGYFKLDILNNSIYTLVSSRDELEELTKKEPNWSLFREKQVVEKLAHISNHYDLIQRYPPASLEELAIVLALIRPAKNYLINQPMFKIKKEIWEKPTDGEYYFKKSHAHAFALSICVQLNAMEKLGHFGVLTS